MKGKKIKCVYLIQTEAPLIQYPKLLILHNETYNQASDYSEV